MNTARVLSGVSEAEYLAGEELAVRRHEYLAGQVYAMADSGAGHNLVTGNVVAALHTQLRGTVCRVFVFGFKVRIGCGDAAIFYYPDVIVSCGPPGVNRYFIEDPKLILEVLSPTTERLDRYEKRTHYQQIETLEEYVLVEQDFAEVTIFRRSNEWQPDVIRGINSEVELQSVGLTLPMAAIYEGVR